MLLITECGFFLVVSLLLGRALFGHRLVNPVAVFFGVWAADFLLLQLDRYIGAFSFTLSSGSERLFFGSFLAFGLASLSVGILAPSSVAASFSDIPIPALRRCNRVLAVLYGAGAVSKYAILIRTFGLRSALSMGRIAISRGEFDYPWICGFLTIFGYLFVLNLGIIAARSRSWRPWIVFALAELIAAINDAPTGYRGQSMNFAFFFAAAWALTVVTSGRVIRLRHLVTTGVVAICLALALEAVHYAAVWTAADSATESELEPSDVIMLGLVLNYIDIVGTIPATTWYLDAPRDAEIDLDSHPGLNTFRGIYQLADKAIAPLGFRVLPEQETPYVPSNPLTGHTFTAFNYLTAFQTDFGTFGAFFLSAILGLSATVIVKGAFAFPTVRHIESAACFLALMAASWRAFYFADPFFWVTLTLIWIQGAYLRSDETSWKYSYATVR